MTDSPSRTETAVALSAESNQAGTANNPTVGRDDHYEHLLLNVLCMFPEWLSFINTVTYYKLLISFNTIMLHHLIVPVFKYMAMPNKLAAGNLERGGLAVIIAGFYSRHCGLLRRDQDGV